MNNQSHELILEDFDHVIFELIDEDLNIFCDSNQGWTKVPVLFSSPERAVLSKKFDYLRDQNGTLKYPILSISRGNIKKPKQRSSIYGFNIPDFHDHKKNSILISKEINHEKTNLRTRLKNYKLTNSYENINYPNKHDKTVYNLKYIKQPSTLEITYNISIKANYIQQINQILSSFLTYTNNINYKTKIRNENKFEIFFPEDNSFSNNTKDLNEEERFVELDFDILLRGHIINSHDNNNVANIVIRESCPDLKFGLEISGISENKIPKQFQLPKFENRNLSIVSYPVINHVIRDSSGGFFISGIFDYVNNIPRKNIVHLNKFGEVTEYDFQIVSTNGTSVRIFLIGNRLFVSGTTLTSAGGIVVNRLCYFDMTDFTCNIPPLTLNSGLITSMYQHGNNLYIGGSFTTINDVSIPRLVKVDKDTLILDETFNLNITSGTVSFINVENDLLYFSGSFTSVLSNTRRYFAVYDLINLQLTDYNPSFSGGSIVSGFEFIDNKLYCFGIFDTVNFSQIPKTRRLISRFVLSSDTNNEDNWDQDLLNSPYAQIGEVTKILYDKKYIYIFGSFTSSNSLARDSVCRVSKDSSLSVDFYQENLDLSIQTGSDRIRIQTAIDLGTSILIFGDFIYNGTSCIAKITK